MQTIEKETRLEKKVKSKDVTTLVKEYMVKIGLDKDFDIVIRKKDNSRFKPFDKKVVFVTPLEREVPLMIGNVYVAKEKSKNDYTIEVDGVTASYPISHFELYDGRKKGILPIVENLDYDFTNNTFFIKMDKGSESIYVLTESIMKSYQHYNNLGYKIDILKTFKYDMESHQWQGVTNSYKVKITNNEPKVDNTVFTTIQKLALENKIIIN